MSRSNDMRGASLFGRQARPLCIGGSPAWTRAGRVPRRSRKEPSAPLVHDPRPPQPVGLFSSSNTILRTASMSEILIGLASSMAGPCSRAAKVSSWWGCPVTITHHGLGVPALDFSDQRRAAEVGKDDVEENQIEMVLPDDSRASGPSEARTTSQPLVCRMAPKCLPYCSIVIHKQDAAWTQEAPGSEGSDCRRGTF